MLVGSVVGGTGQTLKREGDWDMTKMVVPINHDVKDAFERADRAGTAIHFYLSNLQLKAFIVAAAREYNSSERKAI